MFLASIVYYVGMWGRNFMANGLKISIPNVVGIEKRNELINAPIIRNNVAIGVVTEVTKDWIFGLLWDVNIRIDETNYSLEFIDNFPSNVYQNIMRSTPVSFGEG